MEVNGEVCETADDADFPDAVFCQINFPRETSDLRHRISAFQSISFVPIRADSWTPRSLDDCKLQMGD
jgi:hypothetical protein